LKHSYNLLIHKSFYNQVNQFLNSLHQAEKNKLLKQLRTALNRIKKAPLSCARLREIKDDELRGKIRKVYIGGNKGYRLFFIFYEKKNIIIPFFISKQRRDHITYNETMLNMLEQSAIEMFNDFINKNYDSFFSYDPY